MSFNRFDVVWVNLDPTKGKEMKKTRPCVVVSPDELNNYLETVIVVPLTSTIKGWPFRLSVNYAGRKGSMAFDQLRSISKSRIIKKTNKINNAAQDEALNILQVMFSE